MDYPVLAFISRFFEYITTPVSGFSLVQVFGLLFGIIAFGLSLLFAVIYIIKLFV